MRPAAVVVRASWPDERVFHCAVDTLAETMEANGVGRTALILVGAFLGEAPARSKLYDPGFATGFREAKP